ncbi:MAG: HD domain-containing protein [Spirochaetota bacterium]|jgi:dGTPase|nr:HD domain-containing protein [Spirochaetota bacterium]
MNDIFRAILARRDERAHGALDALACPYAEAARLFEDPPEKRSDAEGIRTPFARDSDRVIHSRAYSRYIDKTQVFSFVENDHITHRVLHVQFVSRIGRTVGRALGLNEDLIEAIALGHDIGHAPFGHLGERVLDQICRERRIGCFYHNVQSVRCLHEIENYGKGINLTVQTLDGILCHNGEDLQNGFGPNRAKTADMFLDEYARSLLDEGVGVNLIPMTLEACVVRMADVIAYIGRDVEDAIQIGLIKRGDLPPAVVDMFGSDNSMIIDTLVNDLLENSFGRDEVRFSDRVFEAFTELRDFNYKNIYTNRRTTQEHRKVERIISILFDGYAAEMDMGFHEHTVFAHYCQKFGKKYIQQNGKRAIIDFLAGMTDDYLINQFRAAYMPDSSGYKISESHTR